jgi:hypothetical protein
MAYADTLANSNPQTAIGWIDSVANEDLRHGQLESVARRWLTSDAPAARAWIESSSLPPETKSQLLGP